MRILICWVITLFALMSPSVEVQALAYVHTFSRENNLVVYALNSKTADFAILEAERICERFNRVFNLKSPPKSSPIVLVIGGSDQDRENSLYRVRVLAGKKVSKIQVDWDKVPISSDVFQRGCVRALCIRQVLDSQPQNIEWRIPIWLTEGISVLVSGTGISEEMYNRATLLARTEPELTLDEAIAEMEGKTQLDRDRRCMAAMFCRALSQNSYLQNRFLSKLNWASTKTMREWLSKVMEAPDLNQWWNTTWKWQANQFSWSKLGYFSTLRMLDERGPLEAKDREVINTVANPWFRRWLMKRPSNTQAQALTGQPSEMPKNIELRRDASLDWLSHLDPPQFIPSRNELLKWGLLYSDSGETPKPQGPITKWFERFTR